MSSALRTYDPASAALRRNVPSTAVDVTSTGSETEASVRVSDSATPGSAARPDATVPTTAQPAGDCACATQASTAATAPYSTQRAIPAIIYPAYAGGGPRVYPPAPAASYTCVIFVGPPGVSTCTTMCSCLCSGSAE